MDLSRAEIVVVGNEILSGTRVDSNSAFLGRTFASLGITVSRKVTVRDTREEIAREVKAAIGRTPLVITSGGLGPTLDDLTREALAEATGIGLHLDEAYLREVEDMFGRRGIAFSENNRRVAMVPDRGRFFRNPNGSAPGLCFDGDDFLLVALPGPPRELEPMMADSLVPYLQGLDPSLQPRLERVFRLVGLGESSIDQVVREMMGTAEAIDVASIPHLGWVELTFALREETPRTVDRFERFCSGFAARFEKEIFGSREETLESCVGRLLRTRGETLATAESCTGGLLGGRITAVPGSSNYYLGGAVAYGNDVKQNVLHVSEDVLRHHGAVSGETAQAMARGTREVFGADWAISCTGIAGPGGGTPEKPVGLVYLAVAGTVGAHVERHQFLGNREGIRERAVIAGLNLLRKALLLQKQ